jgi:hypothetical protein
VEQVYSEEEELVQKETMEEVALLAEEVVEEE